MKKSRFLAVMLLAAGLIINSACEKAPGQVSIIDSLIDFRDFYSNFIKSISLRKYSVDHISRSLVF